MIPAPDLSLRTVALNAAMAALICMAARAAYERSVARRARDVGGVGVAEVYRQKESEFTRILTRAVDEADRQQALAMARQFSQRLPAALEELPKDCGCLVVLKTAIAGPTPNTIDLTSLLLQKVQHAQERK